MKNSNYNEWLKCLDEESIKFWSQKTNLQKRKKTEKRQKESLHRHRQKAQKQGKEKGGTDTGDQDARSGKARNRIQLRIAHQVGMTVVTEYTEFTKDSNHPIRCFVVEDAQGNKYAPIFYVGNGYDKLTYWKPLWDAADTVVKDYPTARVYVVLMQGYWGTSTTLPELQKYIMAENTMINILSVSHLYCISVFINIYFFSRRNFFQLLCDDYCL